MVGSLFSWKSFETKRKTTEDLPTAASPERRKGKGRGKGREIQAQFSCSEEGVSCQRIRKGVGCSLSPEVIDRI